MQVMIEGAFVDMFCIILFYFSFRNVLLNPGNWVQNPIPTMMQSDADEWEMFQGTYLMIDVHSGNLT